MTIPHEDLLQMAVKAIDKVAQDNSVSSDQKIDELQALRDFCLSLEQMARPDAGTSVTGQKKVKKDPAQSFPRRGQYD